MATTRRTKEDWELAVKNAYRDGVRDGMMTAMREVRGNVVDNVATSSANVSDAPKVKTARVSIGTDAYAFGTDGNNRYLNVSWAHLAKLTPEVVAKLNLTPTKFDRVDGAKGFKIVSGDNATVEVALCEILGIK